MTAHWIETKRQYRQYKARIAQLPENYRSAVAALERYINHLGGIGDADSFITMLNDLADLFEQGAEQGTPIRDIVGEDPVAFIDTFLSNYPSGRWITREQERLVVDIERAEALDR